MWASIWSKTNKRKDDHEDGSSFFVVSCGEDMLLDPHVDDTGECCDVDSL